MSTPYKACLLSAIADPRVESIYTAHAMCAHAAPTSAVVAPVPVYGHPRTTSSSIGYTYEPGTALSAVAVAAPAPAGPSFQVLSWTALSPPTFTAVTSGATAIMTADKSQTGNNMMGLNAGGVTVPSTQLWSNLGSQAVQSIIVNGGPTQLLDLFFSSNAPLTLTIADEYGHLYACNEFPVTDTTGTQTLVNNGTTVSAATAGKCVHMRLKVSNPSGTWTIVNSAFWNQHAPNLQAVALYASTPLNTGFLYLAYEVLAWSVVPARSSPVLAGALAVSSVGGSTALGFSGPTTAIPVDQLWSGMGSTTASAITVTNAGPTPLFNAYFSANGPVTLTVADNYGHIYGCNKFPATDSTGRYTLTSDGMTLSAATTGQCVLMTIQLLGTGGAQTMVCSDFWRRQTPNLQGVALLKTVIPGPGYV